MSTLAIFVGHSDANGRPLTRRSVDTLRANVLAAIDTVGGDVLTLGTGDGQDETGTAERSTVVLVSVPDGSSHLDLLRRLGRAAADTGQRSFGVVGWHPVSTVVPVDAVESWHVDAVIARDRSEVRP